MIRELDWFGSSSHGRTKNDWTRKKTIVILASDNGPWVTYGNWAGSSGGLKEGKGTTFEGGNRVPCIIRWPTKIPAGVVCNKLSSNLDILPTLAEVCHTKLPKETIDGSKPFGFTIWRFF